MTATAARYRAPYTSEERREPDGTPNECCDACTVMMGAFWTLGEWLVQPDGDTVNPNVMRNSLRARVGIPANGGATLHDMSDMLRAVDPDLPPLLRYSGQTLRPGQSSAGATLRIDWPEVIRLLKNGHAVALCGNPAGVKDPQSPLRQRQVNDDYPHVVVLFDGRDQNVGLYDSLTGHAPDWKGERVQWEDARQFTEAKKPGTNDRQFGSPSSVACAVVEIGAQTEAKRATLATSKALDTCKVNVRDAKVQASQFKDERDDARGQLEPLKAQAARLDAALATSLRDLNTAAAALAACEARPPADCSTVIAERDALLAQVAQLERDVAQAISNLDQCEAQCETQVAAALTEGRRRMQAEAMLAVSTLTP